MKPRFQKQSKERKIIYFIIGLFVLNAFAIIPVWIIGAYTAEPVKISVKETQEDGTIQEKIIEEKEYSEGLSEGIPNYIFEFFRYFLPVTLSGYFLVIPSNVSFDYFGIVLWGLPLISIPLVIKYTSKFPLWRRCIYVYLIAVQISGLWALSHVNIECISFIDYPIRPGPPCR
ncbi:MAG: hypothetical protein P8X78_03025, partial [Nitrosopumilaceae archaeon]